MSALPLRRPLLVNDYERAVDEQVSAVCARYGMRLLLKVGVREVVDRDGLADAQDREYAFHAHFDFLVVDGNGEAVLAVEFDGAAHRQDDKQAARDRRKDRICREALLPIVRVRSRGLRPADHRSLLGWLIEVLLEADRLERQEQLYLQSDGEADRPDVDPDEFHYRTAYSYEEPGMRPIRPLDCFDEARHQVLVWVASRVGRPSPRFFRDPDSPLRGRGAAALEVQPGRWLLGRGSISLERLLFARGGLVPAVVAQDVALLDLARQLEYWQRHESPTLDDLTLQREVRDLKEQALTSLGALSDADRDQLLAEQFGVDILLTKFDDC